MPCSMTRDEERLANREANERTFGVRADLSDILTRVACDLAKHVPEDQRKHLLPLTRRWLDLHALADKERLERELALEELGRAAQEVLDNLTDVQKEALGLL